MVSRPMHWSGAPRAMTLSVLAAMMAATGAAGGGFRQNAAAPAQLELTTSSDAARAMFRQTLLEIENFGLPGRIRELADSTVTLDPTFALARAYQAFYAPGTAQSREQAITAVIGDMASVSVPELLLALYWRESVAGRGTASIPLLESAAAMVPGDPDVAYTLYTQARIGKSATEQITMLHDLIRDFPQKAGAHNLLAYQLFNVGDFEGAVAEAQEYVRMVPDHWNSHDSLADILVLLGRPREALPHVKRSLELAEGATGGDPLPENAVAKLGLIPLMTGDAKAARAEFARAVDQYENPVVKLNFRIWSVATEAYIGEGKRARAAMQEIVAIPTLTPAQTAWVQAMAALVEAYLGDRDASVTHLSLSAAARTPFAYHYGVKALVLARAGDLEGARAAAARYDAMVSSLNTVRHSINALVALAANDLPAARRELDDAPSTDLLAKAARADLLLREGQQSQANALLEEMATTTIRDMSDHAVNIWKLAAKMHADGLAMRR